MNTATIQRALPSAALWLGLVAPLAIAQSGGGSRITRSTIDGGGHMSVTGSGYKLAGTIGQADARRLSGGEYHLNGGFWVPEDCTSSEDCADRDGDGIRDDNCTWWSCAAGNCVGTPVVFADMGGGLGECPPDGTADNNDVFHALNCFADIRPPDGAPGYPCEDHPPQAVNVDAGGLWGDCQPDGVCDGNDAFHALNAFNGLATCSCTASAPTPTRKVTPVVVDEAEIALRALRSTSRPGDLVEVDVLLIGSVADLRGYQLHSGVSGGSRGVLELVDMTSAGRQDHALGDSGHWSAFNAATAQMVAGLATPGVKTAPRAYLATFTYRASSDARGEFIIDLLHDDSDAAQRTFLFPTPAAGRIGILKTVPAVVRISPKA